MGEEARSNLVLRETLKIPRDLIDLPEKHWAIKNLVRFSERHYNELKSKTKRKGAINEIHRVKNLPEPDQFIRW